MPAGRSTDSPRASRPPPSRGHAAGPGVALLPRRSHDRPMWCPGAEKQRVAAANRMENGRASWETRPIGCGFCARSAALCWRPHPGRGGRWPGGDPSLLGLGRRQRIDLPELAVEQDAGSLGVAPALASARPRQSRGAAQDCATGRRLCSCCSAAMRMPRSAAASDWRQSGCPYKINRLAISSAAGTALAELRASASPYPVPALR